MGLAHCFGPIQHGRCGRVVYTRFSLRVGGAIGLQPKVDRDAVEWPIALIDFDNAFQTVPTGSNHRPAEAMQNGPGGLIAAKAQHALQTQGAHSRFLARNMLGGSQPDLHGCARLIENRAGCNRTRMSAGPTNQTSAVAPVGLTLRCAAWTNEPIWPLQPLKISRAIVLGGEPVFSGAHNHYAIAKPPIVSSARFAAAGRLLRSYLNWKRLAGRETVTVIERFRFLHRAILADGLTKPRGYWATSTRVYH